MENFKADIILFLTIKLSNTIWDILFYFRTKINVCFSNVCFSSRDVDHRCICSKHLQLECQVELSPSSSFLKPKLKLVSSKRAEFQKVEFIRTHEFELLKLKFEFQKFKIWAWMLWTILSFDYQKFYLIKT